MKLRLLAAAFLCAATMARAQVQYSGPATPGHVPSNVTNSVIQDSGPATAPNATEFGVHKNGGLPLCVTDVNNPPPFTGQYAQLCFAITPSMSQIIVNSAGGAPAPPLNYVINGVATPVNGAPGSTPLNGGLLSQISTESLQGAPTVLFTGYSVSGDGGGGTFTNVTSCTPDFGTCFQDSNSKFYKRVITTPPYVDAWFDTLAHADAAAAAAGVQLDITKNVTLTSATTLNAPTLYASGGIITMNGQNLTINGQLDGPQVQIVNVGAWPLAGTLAINAGKKIDGNWLCGPWGSNADYSPCIQAAINIVMRRGGNSNTNGPRILDLSASTFFSSLPIDGIRFFETVTWPNQGGYGKIVADGQFFLISQAFTSGGPNQPVFILPSVQQASFLCYASCFFEWQSGSNITSANTLADVFQFTAGSGDGSFSDYFFGITWTGGWGLAYAANDGTTDGWWATVFQNCIQGNNVGTGFYNYGSGTGERDVIRDLLATDTTTTLPIVNFGQQTELELDQISIDGFGQTTPATNPAVSLNGSWFDLRNIHIESYKTANNTNAPAILINQGVSVPAHGTINGLNISGTVGSTSNFYGVQVANGSSVTIDNYGAVISTLGSGSLAQMVFADAPSNIRIGRNLYVGSNIALFAPFTVSGNTTMPSSITLEGGRSFIYYANSLAATAAETDMASTAAALTGNIADRAYYYTGMNYYLSTNVTSGSITLRTYSGSTLIDTRVINTSSTGANFLQFQSGLNQSAFKYGALFPIRVTIQTSGINAGINIQVALRLQ